MENNAEPSLMIKDGEQLIKHLMSLKSVWKREGKREGKVCKA